MKHPLAVRQHILDTLIRYIETTYSLRSPDLANERRLLLQDESLVQDVYLEPVPPYPAAAPATEALAELGLDDPLAELLTRAVFQADEADAVMLRPHQRESIDTVAAGLNPVITSGTGSGKTEAYLEAVARTLKADPEAQMLILLPEIALTQALIEPIVHKGIDQNWLLSVRWQH